MDRQAAALALPARRTRSRQTNARRRPPYRVVSRVVICSPCRSIATERARGSRRSPRRLCTITPASRNARRPVSRLSRPCPSDLSDRMTAFRSSSFLVVPSRPVLKIAMSCAGASSGNTGDHFRTYPETHMTTPTSSQTALMANAIRALAMDAVQKANSGHPGMPMGMAEIAVALWYAPSDATIRPTRTGPIATASCCRTATARCCCMRCCT